MARIRKFDLPPDLFENQAIGMQKLGTSIPKITLEDYRIIVLETIRVFKTYLNGITAEVLNEAIAATNEVYACKTSLVARKSLTITVIVNTVEDRNVSVILHFDDLKSSEATGAVIAEIFKKLAELARFPEALEVSKYGTLIGRLEMPAKIYVFPNRRKDRDKKDWPNHVESVAAELEALKQLQSHPLSH